MKKFLILAVMGCASLFSKINESDLVLYIRASCPYCKKVVHYLDNHNIHIKQVDITRNLPATEELIRKGGKRQVPCLFIKGKPMYESRDIIAFLKKEFE